MQIKRPLVIGLWALLSSSVLAHPGSGIVVDPQGNVFVGDITPRSTDARFRWAVVVDVVSVRQALLGAGGIGRVVFEGSQWSS